MMEETQQAIPPLSPEEQRFIELREKAHQKYGDQLPPEIEQRLNEVENKILELQVDEKLVQDEQLRSQDETTFQAPQETVAEEPQEPVISVTINEEEDDNKGQGPGLLGTLRDMAVQGIGGIRDASVNTITGGLSLVNEIDRALSVVNPVRRLGDAVFGITEDDRAAFDEKVDANIKAIDDIVPDVPEAETVAGAVTGKLTQIAASIVGPAKFFKGYKAFQKAPAIMRSMMVAGTGEFFAFDKYEESISNIVVEHLGDKPSAVRDFFELLSVDEDDSEVEARLKRTLEASAVDLTTTGIVLPLFRHLRKLPKLVKEGSKAVAQDLQKVANDIAQKSNVEILNDIFDDDASDGILKAGVSHKTVVAPTPPSPDVLAESERFAAELNKIITGEEDLLQVDLSGLINVDTFKDPKQTQAVLEAYLKAAKKSITEISKMTNAQTVEEAEKKFTQIVSNLSDITDEDAGSIMSILTADAENINEAMINGVIAKNTIVAINKKLVSLIDPILRGEQEAIEEGSKLLGILDNLTQRYKRVGTASGRLLQSRQIKDNFASDVGELLTNRSTDDIVELMAHLKDAKNNHQIYKMITGFLDGVQNYWINGLLSSPFTHLVNFTSNTINTFRKPLDLILGGVLTGDLDSVKEGVTIYMGLARFWKEALQAAGESAVKGPILRGAPSTLDADDFVPGTFNFAPVYKGQDIMEIIAEGDEAKIAAAIQNIGSRWLYNVINIPSTSLNMADELFLQMNYKSALYAKTIRDAIDQGLKPGTDEFSVFVEETVKRGTDKTRKAVSETSTQKEAFRYATDANFSTELDYDGLVRGAAKFLQQLTNSPYPPVRIISRFISPFLRTPANLLQDVIDSTPVASRLLSQRFRDDIAAGGGRRAAAIGKVFTGSLIWSSMLALASQGHITGSGPTDPDIRKQLEKAGWRPHSFVWQDQNGHKHYLDLSRFDPFATFLVAAGDYMEGIDALERGDEEEFHKKMLANIVNNLSSKKYLTGAINVVSSFQRMAQGESDEQFVSDLLSSFVPSIVKDVRQIVDPFDREARTILEKIKNRTPGFSDELPMKYDLRGKPQLGPTFEIYFNNKGRDVVDEEIERLSQFGIEVTSSPETYQGVDLREFRNKDGRTAYERLNQLLWSGGVSDPEGRSLSDALKELITSPEYQELSDPLFKDGAIPGGPGGKVAFIRDIAQEYRKAAMNHIFQNEEFVDKDGNELFTAIQESRLRGQIKTRGDAERLQEILDQLN